MEKENEILEEETQDKEDLLNFDLDDLSLDDIDQEISESGEIIELVDLVEKGEKIKGTGEGEMAEPFELEVDQIVEEKEELELDAKAGQEEIIDEEEIAEGDLEELLKDEPFEDSE